MRIISLIPPVLAAAALASAASFSNPLKAWDGSDPHIVFSDGYYYLMTTTWTNLQITRAKTLEGLKTGETRVVWTDSNPSRCCNVWAPELHRINDTYEHAHIQEEGENRVVMRKLTRLDRWYIYYTAGNGDNLDGQRSHVLKGTDSLLPPTGLVSWNAAC